MADSKPNSDRRVEGEEFHDLSEQDIKHRSTRMPDRLPNDDARTDDGNSVGDEEPGPYDDDGLPENARRRVPS